MYRKEAEEVHIMDISDFVEAAEKLNVLGIKITKDDELIAEWHSEEECRSITCCRMPQRG